MRWLLIKRRPFSFKKSPSERGKERAPAEWKSRAGPEEPTWRKEEGRSAGSKAADHLEERHLQALLGNLSRAEKEGGRAGGLVEEAV